MSDLDATEVTRTGLHEQAVESLSPGDVIDRFSIVSEIGSGGMGRIYEALDPNLQRRVALKLLHEQGSDTHRQRLLREAQALAQLDHPNVITVHEVGEHQSQLFIAMELVSGGTLKTWMATHPPGKSERQRRVAGLLAAAGRGLLAAHAAGLIHRDVKPSNILIGDDERPRVADFGIVRSLRETPANAEATLGDREADPATLLLDSASGTLTRSGASVGTPAYMAPEQFGHGEVGDAADQFSFCVTAWEALFGERPFEGATLGVLMGNVRENAISVPDTSLPDDLVRTLRRGLSFKPGQRHRSLGTIVEQLDAFARTGKSAPRSRRWPLYGVGVVTVVAAALAYQVVSKPSPCPSSAPLFEEVWTSARRETLLASSPDLVPRLDEYGAAWVEAYDEACRASRLRGEQTAEQMAERRACLELERESLAVALSGEDSESLEHHVRGAAPPSTCDHGFGISLGLPEFEQTALEASRSARSEARYEDALEVVERALESDVLTPGGRSRLTLERGLSMQGKTDDTSAGELFEAALAAATRHGDRKTAAIVGLHIATLERDNERRARSLIDLARGTLSEDDQPSIRLLRRTELAVEANWAPVGDKLEAARRFLDAAQDKDALLLVAQVYLGESLYDEALELIERAESLGPPYLGALSPAGLRCMISTAVTSETAKEDCDRAFDLRISAPHRVHDPHAIGGNLRRCARSSSTRCQRVRDEAEEFLSPSQWFPPRSTIVILELIRYLESIDRPDDALAYAERGCNTTSPTKYMEVRSCTQAALLRIKAGDRDSAVVAIRKASARLSRLPANAFAIEGYSNASEVYDRLGLSVLALEHAKKAAQLGEGTALEETEMFTGSHVNYCGQAAKRLPPEEAIPICENAVELLGEKLAGAGSSIVWNNLGVAYFNSGRFDDSVRAYEAALERVQMSSDPPARLEAVTLANLAEAHEKREDFSSAARRYEEAFERCDRSWSTYYFSGTGLARSLAAAGQFAKAREVLGTMKGATPRTAVLSRAKVQEARGFVESRAGLTRKSNTAYEDAIELYEIAGANEHVSRLCAALRPKPASCPSPGH